MPDNPFAKYGGKPVDDNPFAKYGGSAISTAPQGPSTEDLLAQGRANLNTPQGGVNYQDLSPSQTVLQSLKRVGGMAKGAIEFAGSTLTNPQKTGELIGSQVDAAKKAYQTTPQDAENSAYEGFRKVMTPFMPLPSEAQARAGMAMFGGNPDAFSQAVAQRQPGKALVEASPLLAAATTPEVARRIGGAAEGLQTRMRGTVTANPDPATNLAAAAAEGGKPAGGIKLHEDVAQPAVNDFRQAAADVGLDEAAAKGPNAHNKFVEATQKMVANADAQARPILDAVRNRATNGIQNTIADQIEKSRPLTAEPSVSDAYGRLAEKIRNAKTMGDLLDIKADLNKLSSNKAFSSISSDQISSLDAAAQAGDIIRNNLYPEIGKITGQDIGPIMKAEQNAIRLQTQAEKAAPSLSTQQAKSQTISYTDRLRSGETLLDTAKNAIGVGKPTSYQLFQQRLARAVQGAKPSNPPYQGPVQVAPGRYVFPGDNPIGPPNPGTPAPTPALPDTAPSLSKFNPYSNPAGKQGGHAGGGVASIEEISRPGQNVSFSASGQPSFHGKSFAPESTPQGGAHVTVFPDGTYRLNAGTMTPALQNAIQTFLKNYRR